MKKLLIYTGILLSTTVFCQYTPADSIYDNQGDIRDLSFGDSSILFQYKFNALIGRSNDSTATPGMVSDSTQYLLDSLGVVNTAVEANTGKDTTGIYHLNRTILNNTTASYTSAEETKLSGIETGAEVNNISDANATELTGGGETSLHSHAGSIDSLQTFKKHKDTIRMTCFSNPYDTIHISRPLTIFLDTTNSYGHEGTTTLYFNGQNTYGTDSVTWTTNADILNVDYNADSLWRANLKGNYCIIYQGKPTPYRLISVICDTFTYPSDDVNAPYMTTFEVGNINDSLIVGIANEDLNTDSVPNFVRDSIYHKFAYGTDTIYSDSVYVNGDTIFYMIPYALSADSTIKAYYIQTDSAGYEDLAGNKMKSYSDSSVTNNVSAFEDMIAYYPLNYNCNDTLNNHNGTGTDITYVSGQVGAAAVFNGSSSKIDITDHDDLSFGNGSTDSPFSLSIIVDMDDATNARFFDKGSNTQQEYHFYVNGSDQLAVYLYDYSTGGYIGRTYTSAITSDEGSNHHYVMTYDGSGDIRIYRDGTRVDNNDSNGGSYTAMENRTADLKIGTNQGESVWFDGDADEARIYNKELSQAEVTALYNSYFP